MMLLAGSPRDPNIVRMHDALRLRGYEFFTVDTDKNPLLWDVSNDTLMAGTRELEFTKVFSRPNVFGYDLVKDTAQHQTTSVWHELLHECAVSRGANVLNKEYGIQPTKKMGNLLRAKEAGFDIPETYVTNRSDLRGHVDATTFVVKPVPGGQHTKLLSDVADPFVNGPCFVQRRMQQPEVRIYKIGPQAHVFKMHTDSLDYRERQDVKVEYVIDPAPYAEYIESLHKLADTLQMDYCSVDLKSTGNDSYVFLEINAMPMFAAFDMHCGMKISTAIADYLHEAI